MVLLSNIAKDMFVPISQVNYYKVYSTGEFFEDSVHDPEDYDTEAKFKALYGDHAGFIEVIAYTSDIQIQLYRDEITFSNYETAKDDAIKWLTDMLEVLSESGEI